MAAARRREGTERRREGFLGPPSQGAPEGARRGPGLGMSPPGEMGHNPEMRNPPAGDRGLIIVIEADLSKIDVKGLVFLIDAGVG